MGATEDIGPTGCTAGANENVWFEFTAQGVSAQINVNTGIGTPEITIWEFPGAPCDGPTAQEVDCANGATLIIDGQLVIGTTYYIMVAFTNNADGNFDLCVTNPVPAVNDDCTDATVIVNVDNNCVNGNNNFPATDVLIPGCFLNNSYTVWYSFTAVGVSLDLWVPSGPGPAQIALVDFATPCTFAGAQLLGCEVGTDHLIIDGDLVIGQQYYVAVGFQNTNFTGAGTGAFELCIDNPEPAFNDDCNDALPIPSNILDEPDDCVTSISGNQLNNDFPSTDVLIFGCWNMNQSANVWYSFVAQGPDVEVTVDPAFAGDAQIALVDFTGGPCDFNGAILLECANGTPLDYNNELVIGQTYYIAIGFENNGVGDYCITVFNPEPPPNDMICDAQAISTNGNCVNGTTQYANPEDLPFPGSCGAAVENVVWYTWTMQDPDNVGFEVDLSLDMAPPGTQIAMMLYQTPPGDCSNMPNPTYFYCGPPINEPLEFGPVDETATFYMFVGTSEQFETGFEICVDEIPPCFTNDICEEATVINGVVSDQPFVCIEGCNQYADPEEFNNGCEIGNFSTVWFQLNSDNNASLLNINVQSDDFLAPTIQVFQAINGCAELQPIGLTQSNLGCILGSNGEASALGTDIGALNTYYIAISSFNSAGGTFDLCVNTISQATNCVLDAEINIVSRSNGGPLTGPFFPGETVSICMDVNSYTAANNNCQWFQGIVPIFGDGWDPSSFSPEGEPAGATVNGNAMAVPGNGVYGGSTWEWFTDVDYHYNHPNYQLGDWDGNGTIELCHNLYDPNCPATPGLMGGCCGPCWGAPLGTILPGGWFAYGINGTCNTPGPPVGVDWGDGGNCGTMGSWSFCFDMNVKEYPECLDGQTLSLGFFTFADGEIGAWVGGPSVCALDQPLELTLPMCCDEIQYVEEEVEPICSGQQFVYIIDEPGVEYWEWTTDPGSITGTTEGSGFPGAAVINTLINTSGDVETAIYTFLGFAGGPCPVFQKEVSIDVYPEIEVVIPPQVMCGTPTTPYIVTPEVTGGDGNYFFQWNNGSTDESLTIANPVHGTQLIVTVTDNVGCFGTAAVVLEVYTTFPVDIEPSALEQCAQDGPISLDANADGGMPDYSFEWTFPSGTSTMQGIQSTDNGKHLVVVTDSEGCVGKDSVEIMFHEEPSVFIDAVNGALAICEGESTELAAVASGGTTPYQYEWETPEGFDSGKNIDAFTPGDYTVTVEDANGCTAEFLIEILAEEQPMPDLGDDHILCNSDDPTELTVTPQFEDYQWSVGSQADGLQSIEVYQPGIYSVTVTNEAGCTGVTSVEIELFDQPVFTMPDTFSKCPGQTIEVDIDLEEYGGPWDNYNWVSGCAGCSSIEDLGVGHYEVYVYDENGCSAFQEFEVVDNILLDAGLTGDDVICTGETITLTAGSGFVNYQWSANTGAGNTQTADITAADTYGVTVTDGDGCTGTGEITVTSGDFMVTITGPASICENVTATLDAGGPYVSYVWSSGNTDQTDVVDDGTHSVTVTNQYGCVASDDHTIAELPFEPTISGTAFICQDGSTSTLTVDGGPHQSYLWSANAGGAVTPSVDVSMPGTYVVTVTDLVGCVGLASFDVAYHPIPFVAISGNPDFCVGGSTQITATAGFVSYLWNTTDATPSITVNTQGVYTVTVTDGNGCTNSASFTVNAPFQETVEITGSFTFCPGDQATLAVPNTYSSITWSTGETVNQIYVTFEGEVSVIVIDADGCIAFDTVQTDENSTLSPSISGPTAMCDSDPIVLDAGPGFDNYMWSNGLGTNQTATVTTPGTYSVTVSSNAGCVGGDSHTVTGYTTPVATVTPTASACSVQEPGGPTTIVNFNSLVTGGDTGGDWSQTGGPGSVNISNPASVNFNGLAVGTYTFTYTTNSATAPCTESTYDVSISVTECACPALGLTTAPDLCNNLGSITLNSLLEPPTQNDGQWVITSTPAGSNPAVINGGEFDASNADAGTYTLTYTLSGLPSYCPSVATVDVNVLPTPDAGYAAPALAFCQGENQTVTLSSLLIDAGPSGEWVETSQFPSTGGAFNPNNGTFNTAGQIPGTYLFSYVIQGPGPCPDDMTTVEVVIENNPVADAGNTATLTCLVNSVVLGGPGTSVGQDFSYLWSTIDGELQDETSINPIATDAGTYTLVVTNNLTGCTASDQVTIDAVGEFPTDMGLIVLSPDCEGDPPGSVTSNIVGGTPPFMFSLNGATSVATNSFTNLQPGDYTLQVVDASGCTLSESFTIDSLVVVDVSIVNENDTLVFDLGETVTFSYEYLGTNNTPDSIVWKSGDSIICVNCDEITFDAYLADQITLEAYDVRGCSDEDFISYLVIRMRDVYIPNVFSPGNGDGINDFFTLFSDSDVKEITVMEIFSRWGDKVFSKENFQENEPNLGWDGEFRGQLVQPGVYVYRIEVEYGDGVKATFHGDITVIR